MLNFDRYTVKHGTRNIQKYCHQWLSDSFEVHRTRFQTGRRPEPHSGSLQRSSNSLAGLRGPTSKSEGKGEKKGREREREGPPRKFLDPPLTICMRLLPFDGE